MKKVRIILVVISLLVALLACFGFMGYFGVKTMRRINLRMEAREAYAAEDWKKAETLLKQYVEQDYNSEEDFVRLAMVYRHFGKHAESAEAGVLGNLPRMCHESPQLPASLYITVP